MKVAVCLSGHLRTFEKTHQKLHEHLLGRHDCDVYIHTWDVLGTSRAEDAGGETKTIDYLSKINEAYNPRRLLVEGQKNFLPVWRPCFLQARTKPENVMSKWYSAQQSFQSAMGSGEKYDLVASLRTDMLFHADVDLTLKSEAVHVPGNIHIPKNGVHDYFAFGSPELMAEYFGVFDNFGEATYGLFPFFRPELMLARHLQLKQVPLDFVDISYSLARLNGELRRCDIG